MKKHLACIVAWLAILGSVLGFAETEEPVAHWTFDGDDAPGLRVLDASGNENHGLLRGGQWVSAGGGHALRFSEDTQYVDIENPPALDIVSAVTLEAWVFPEKVPDSEVGIVGKSICSYGLTYYKDGNCYWYISSGGNKCSAPLATNLWIYVVGVFDGKELRLFINGVLADVTESQFDAINKDADFYIGRIRHSLDPVSLTKAFHGLIDNVRVYDQALSAEEILDHFNTEASGYDGRTSSDDFEVMTYCYPEENKVYVDVDCTALFPRPATLDINVALYRGEGQQVIQERNFTLTANNMVARDISFDTVLDEGTKNKIVVTVGTDNNVRAEKEIALSCSEERSVPDPETFTVPALSDPRKRPKYIFALEDNGGFRFGIAENVCAIESTYSFPLGGKNSLGAISSDTNETTWQSVGVKVNDTHYKVTAHGAFYTLERNIELLAGRILVHDALTNTGNEPVGIMIDNYIDAQGHESVSTQQRPNPTMFLRMPGCGIGMVALDDVYLEQYETYYDNGSGGISTNKFALDAGASYTLEWAVYVNDTGDYYDFINDVRTDEGMNRPILGSFAFVDRREPPSREYVDRRGLAYTSIGCLGNPPDNPGLSLEGVEFMEYPQECALLKKTFAETRARYPEMQTMFHIAHSLYTTNQPDKLFGDSRTLNSDGEQTMYGGNNPDYYVKYFSKENVDAGYRWYIYYPASDNSYGPAMLKAIDYMLDEIGCTSMFADGFTHGYGGRFTYERWDGHTADIDPDTGLITRKYASVNLLAQDILVQVARKVEARGGVVICNSYPGTRTVHKENVLYCIESASGDAQLERLHLVPGVLALGNHIRLAGGDVRYLYDDIRSKLHYGGLYFYYGDKEAPHPMPTTRMFPITQTELHEGWVKGKERIVTSVPGVYGWSGDQNLHAVYLWDGRGVPVKHNYTTTVDASGVRTQVELKPNEMAVVERVPVTVETSAAVNVRVHQYSKDNVALLLHGNGKATLILEDGVFPVSHEVGYVCKIGDTVSHVSVNERGALYIPITLKGTMDVTLSPES